MEQPVKRQISKRKSQSVSIRTLEPSDSDAVRKISFAHFRSLAPAAVVSFCTEHIQNTFVLVASTKLFVSWFQLLILMLIFLSYLWVRAKYEMECYIRRHCPDLLDIPAAYLSGPTGHFWVAETFHNKMGDKVDKGEIVGCIGILPYRGHDKVAQLMRLIVSEKCRRMRVGSRLLAQLEKYALEKGFTEIRLYTNDLNKSHMKFVRIHGFEILQIVRRGLMRGDLIQWNKQLVQKEDPNAIRPRPQTNFQD